MVKKGLPIPSVQAEFIIFMAMKISTLLFTFLVSLSGFSQSIIFKNTFETNRSLAPTTSLFVDADETSLKTFLAQHRGVYKYKFRNYHHIQLPSVHVQQLAKENFVKHIDFHFQHPVALNDSMRVKTKINLIHAGQSPLPKGYTGKNILVGFIDDGIDFNHPDFQDSLGNTRVVAIWDQSEPFDVLQTPMAYGYGQLWDSIEINAGSCTSQDLSGHGTTVAGTASGNGRSTGTHQGAAPDSYVVMVKSDFNAPNWLGTVADAVDFIYKLADSLNMPCVINASVGDYYGSHDGRDLAAQYIDSLIRAKRGRLMVAALGNSGTLPPYHLETYVDADTSFTWFKYNGSSALGYGSVFFETFADTSDFSNVWFSVGADEVSPNYKFRGETPFHKVSYCLDTIRTDTIFSANNDILGIVDFYAEYMGDVVMLQVHMSEPDSNQYNFRFSTTGSGRWDTWTGSWMGISNMVNTGLPTVGQFPDIVNYVSPDSAKVMVSSFQCLESVVTVANYNNIQNYIGYDLLPVALGEPEGAISSTSSRGPTRDNRMKPDVAATGNVTFSPGPLPILAALISGAPHKLLPDGMHMRNGGTSMASPVVAGTGALFLERCPTINWEEFKGFVNDNAFSDGFTGTVPNISFGNGKLDAYAALVNTVYSVGITGDNSLCEGQTELFSVPAGMQSYMWSTGETTTGINIDSAQTIWFTGIDQMGCVLDTSYETITENPIPVIVNSLDFDTFTGSTSTSGGLYQWYLDGVAISGANDSTHVAAANGNYFVTITDGSGCVGYSDTILFNTLGIETLGHGSVSVFPNPFSNEIIINCDPSSKIEIRNSIGQLVLMTEKNKSIATASWQKGIYFVTIYEVDKQENFKVVKN